MEYNIMAGWLGGYYVEGIDPKDTACLSPFNTKLTDQTNVMQFIGLHDKKGKEIYEGDIVKRKTKDKGVWKVERVHWVQRTGFAPFHRGLRVVKKFPGGVYTQSEIIGNIYENPELLTN